MGNFKKAVCVFFSILFGSSLLSGANVIFDGFYKFSEGVSRFTIMLIVYLFLVNLSLKIMLKIGSVKN